jgi:hypothetical protein
MLQSTLEKIRGLIEVKFRVYELYGLGVQYPHYWNQNIYQNIITYDLSLSKTIHIENSEDGNHIQNIQEYIKSMNGFITIEEDKANKIFKSFSNFIDQLDEKRRKYKRIRITPNNPESSRSIVVYEFLLLIENDYVPFIIIDLPGREELVETYVDNYLAKDFIPENIKTPFYETLLSSMAINPLGLAILVPTVIFDTFNDLHPKIASEIMGIYNNSKFKDEIFSYGSEDRRIENANRLSKLYNFTNFNNKFDLINNPKCSNNKTDQSCQKYIVKLLSFNGSKKQIPININSIQYQGVLALFLLNRIIMMNKFDILQKIYEKINEIYIIPYISIPNDKIRFLEKYHDNIRERINKINQSDRDNYINHILNETLYFDIGMSPFEGIYINENIVGLMKVLSKNILNKTDSDILPNLMSKQESIPFDEQKIKLRKINDNLYTQNPDKYEPFENIFRNNEILQEINKDNRTNYSSQNIFNYDIPYIEPIIDIYTNPSKINNINRLAVSDFKVFYLFSNTQMDKKCEHQYKLLENTRSFIESITQI